MKYVLVALLALLAVANAGVPTAVDNLRNELLELEQVLWMNIASPEWNAAGFDRIAELSKSIVAFDERVQAMPEPPRVNQTRWLAMNLEEQMRAIEKKYKRLLKYIKDGVKKNKLMKLISSVAQLEDTVGSLFEYGNIFLDMLKEDNLDQCKMQTSQHQLVYDRYNMIALCEIKGYATMQFSWMLLRISEEGKPNKESDHEVCVTRLTFLEATLIIADAATEALAATQRDLHRCDPPEHKIGETYEEVSRSSNVSNDRIVLDVQFCKSSYVSMEQCYKELCPEQSGCAGRIRIVDCNVAEIKRSDTLMYQSVIKYTPNSDIEAPSKMRQKYSDCLCVCEDEIESFERFSLREAFADTEKNKVMTGLRLVKYDGTFYLQIKEGTLGERGSITPGSWVPVDRFNVSEQGIRSGVDYHTLTHEKRAIDLDELKSPYGQILTGVRFRLVGSHLHFEIQSTPFDYDTGELEPDSSEWIGNDDTADADKPRTELGIYGTNSQYVPFVDIQPLEPMNGAALLGGAGVQLRSGGFLAATLLTYDYSLHIKPHPPPSDQDEEESSCFAE